MVDNRNNSLPLVSVVLPVYNEEQFIGETLEGIITQDYPNLEILVSDNHSTDATASLCREYALDDRRIQFFAQPSNIGAVANHTFLANKALGKYLIFAAGHDKWSANYLTTNVDALEERSSAVISYGTPCWIDQDGDHFDRFSGWYDTRGLPVLSRFFFAFWGKPNPILGLIRRDKLPDLAGYNFAGSDNVILCLLSLQGEFVHTVTSSFYRRQNRQFESYDERMKRYVSAELKMTNSFLTSLFPLIRMPFELIKTVFISPISLANKFMTLILLLPAIPIKFFVEKSASR